MTTTVQETTHPNTAPRRVGWTVVASVISLVGVVSLVSALIPGWAVAQGLSVRFPVAQLAAFPLLLGAAMLLCSALTVLICRAKRSGWLGWSACIIWALAGIAFIAAPEGLPREVAPASPAAGSGPVEDTTGHANITIATFNTASTLTADDLKSLVAAHHPDVIMLPETGGYEARQAVKSIGYPGQVFETPDWGFTDAYTGGIAPTSVVVSDSLGPAKHVRGPATSFGTVELEFEDPSLPRIIGVHTAPPLPGLMKQWRTDLKEVAAFGESASTPTVIAGDFNATLRHGPLAARTQLVDSQKFCSRRQAGTWPARMPNALRAPIDHIFVTHDMRTQSCQTMQVGSSDHLAYVTTVSTVSAAPTGAAPNADTAAR